MTTDAQAALAAAAHVMSSWLSTGAGRLAGISPEIASQFTTTMAGQFLRELQRAQGVPVGRPTVVPGDAQTERIDPSAVLAAAADASLARPVQRYVGPHVMSGTGTTPSGKYACLCGEAWPCSQRDIEPPRRQAYVEGMSLDQIRHHVESEQRGGR